MGAVCKVCGKDMMKAKGCGFAKVHVCGKVYDRIKVGAPGDFDEGRPETTRCHDCNAMFGHLHHWGCDAERLRRSIDQLRMRGCFHRRMN